MLGAAGSREESASALPFHPPTRLPAAPGPGNQEDFGVGAAPGRTLCSRGPQGPAVAPQAAAAAAGRREGGWVGAALPAPASSSSAGILLRPRQSGPSSQRPPSRLGSLRRGRAGSGPGVGAAARRGSCCAPVRSPAGYQGKGAPRGGERGSGSASPRRQQRRG